MRTAAPILLVLAVAAVAGCRPAERNESSPGQAANNVAVAAPVAAEPESPPPAIDRAALLIEMIRARSAAASGADDRVAQAALDGRVFDFRIALGCDRAGVPAAEAAEAAKQEPGEGEITLSAAPDLTGDDPLAAAIAGEAYEAVEGFRIADPWLLVARCPVVGAIDGAMPGMMGLAQFYGPEDARTGRRDGRAYVARAPLPPLPADGGAGAAGWELVLNGRLAKLADGRVIQCRTPAGAALPSCIASVRFDRVAIAAAGDGSVLAEWRTD